MMRSTLAVHTKGVAVVFHAARNSSMQRCNSRTLRKVPQRTALGLSSATERSIRLSQLELVGMKCSRNRGCHVRAHQTQAWPCVP